MERDGSHIQPSPANAGQAYQRLTQALQTDPRCAHEVSETKCINSIDLLQLFLEEKKIGCLSEIHIIARIGIKILT